MNGNEKSTIDGLLMQLDGAGIRLWSQDGCLRFRGPVGALTAELRTQLEGRRQQVVDYLDKQSRQRASAWFRVWQPRPEARMRVFCLPHAGGAASFFREWGKALPFDVEVVTVQYPGREERIEERLLDDLQLLVKQLTDSLERLPHLLDRPYVLFGHSMGGAVAHELCLTLRARDCPMPEHLVVSACEAPSRRKEERFHLASNAELQDEIVRLGGTHADIVRVPELAELVLPVIRSDYRLIETYRPDTWRTPLELPISAFTGDEYGALDPDDARAWAEETKGDFVHREFSGGHFYLVQQRQAVLKQLLRLVQAGDASHLRPGAH